MSYVLGVGDSSYDSSAVLMKDGEIITAIEEERLNRIKHSGGFPFHSIKKVLEISGVHPNEVDLVAYGTENPDFLVMTMQKINPSRSRVNPLKSRKDDLIIRFFEKYYQLNHSNSIVKGINKKLTHRTVKQFLKGLGIKDKKIVYVDHHYSHACSAFFSSGFKESLVITADARGDALSMTVSIGDQEGLKRISSSPVGASMGNLYGAVTEALGFEYASGEGKTEALAAFGVNTDLYKKLKTFIHVDGLKFNGYIAPYHRRISVPISQIIQGYKRENIAFAIQNLLEEKFCELVANAIAETGIKNIALAGGIFFNVKLNQKIMYLPDIKDIHIFPAAGDNGISSGAAFAAYHSEIGEIKNKRWEHVYLGTEYSNEEIEATLKKKNVSFEKMDDIAGYVGEEILPEGNIIGWYQGRMEYGPRALGHRTVLISPQEKKYHQKILDTIKKRPPFQPFCPSMIKEAEKDYLENPKNVANPFMIITFYAHERMRKKAPVGVFIDGSVRVQTVDKETEPKYHGVIEAFGNETGTPILINTSFNRSGEAIVENPNHAITDLYLGRLDYLVIGDYLVKR